MTVDADGPLWVEARVDEAALRKGVERYAKALVEADRRIKEAGDAEGRERELARVRREPSSHTATDTVMAGVAS